MSAGRFTERAIDALTPTAGAQYVFWDQDLAGFGVRVSPAGTKAFIYKYRLPSGRVRWASIGRVGELPLELARKRAKVHAGKVANGEDPLRSKDAARGAVTVATIADRFLKEYVEPRKKPATLRQYTDAIRAHITPVLGAIPIADVVTDDAVRLHHRLRSTPVLANRVVAVLSKLLAWSVQAKARPAGPNPCVGIEKFPEKKRKRYLDSDEYARLGRALRTAAIGPAPRTAIELLLLTGARPSEVATLQWAHVNLKRGALELPDSKTGAKVIHLSAPAIRLLKKWPRFVGSPYVFPGNGRKKQGVHIHGTTLAHVWSDIRKAAGLDPSVRLYDACRHSYASVAISRHGLTLAQIGEQLGHSQPSTTARYSHLHDDVAKSHATAIGGTIAAALRRRVR